MWRLSHPEHALEWNLSTPGHVWVWEQMRTDRLAVIAWETSYDEIKALGGYRHGFRRGALLEPAVFHLQPEVGFDAPFTPPRNRLSLMEVDRHVDWLMFAHLLGVTEEEFKARDKAGQFAPPEPSLNLPFLVYPWWPTDYVLDYLERADPRRNEMSGLQQKVGRNDPCPCGSGLKFKRCCGG